MKRLWQFRGPLDFESGNNIRAPGVGDEGRMVAEGFVFVGDREAEVVGVARQEGGVGHVGVGEGGAVGDGNGGEAAEGVVGVGDGELASETVVGEGDVGGGIGVVDGDELAEGAG